MKRKSLILYVLFAGNRPFCVTVSWSLKNDLKLNAFSHIHQYCMCTHSYTHRDIHACTSPWYCLIQLYYLGGRATLRLIVSWSYCAAHLWRSHYKIHKLFRHVAALFSLSSYQLVQHNCLKSPSPLCSIDRIKQLLLIRKLHRAPKERHIETKR